MCESLPACRAVPCARRAAYVRQPNTAWIPGLPPAGNPGMKKPPATQAGGTGISAGGWDLIAATRASVTAALSRAGPVLQEVICHAKHQPQGGGPFLAAGDGSIITINLGLKMHDCGLALDYRFGFDLFCVLSNGVHINYRKNKRCCLRLCCQHGHLSSSIRI